MKRFSVITFLFVQTIACCFLAVGQQENHRPKIGLALSGGGAKGLAHIGILKAIDSAGLKIDYITGTSMGSIIGGLYAVGYPADSIEKMARDINWDLLLSNQASLRTLFMEEKDEYSKYTVELPWVNHGFQLPTGVLQGQELWLKLSEMLFPVYNQKDFSKFNIPFKCIGTDVGNGEAIVMSKGEITSAIRASMAIPSFFTAVDYDGKKLVDGGVVRNFPVRDVKEMGAGFVIGSNVAGGLLSSDKVRNAIQVLLQVAFFREAQDHKEEVALCDIYVPFEMPQYNMGSFAQSADILELGIKEGRKLYPRFRQIADSLNTLYGPQEVIINRLPSIKPVKISSYEIKGLRNTGSDFFVHTMNLITNQEYTPAHLSRMVRAAFGTRYYSRVTYALEPQPDSSCKIVFDVTENPLSFAKLSLHYNKFSGIAAIVNLTTRNLIITNSRDLITLNIGETFRARAEHLQYIGRRKNFSLTFAGQYDRFDVNTYNTYKQSGIYKQAFFKFDTKAQYSTLRNLAVGIGERFETISYKPAILSGFQFSGNNNFFTTYFFVAHNSLDKVVYPRRGVKLHAEFGLTGSQDPGIDFFLNGQQVTPDSLKVSSYPYARVVFNFDSYTPLSRRSTLEFLIQSGINFDYSSNIMNEFAIGGLTPLFRNQVVFAGLQEGSLYTP
ncbi:MAG TPA: patatin-like phospholipase family protein, partial [Chitinophagaceae bacterium]|nr:patatin-like phospholipase family protein [Chitinophagaceae bacterium]